MNLTSYIGLSSVAPVGRTTWASFVARTLKFTFVDVVVIGLKRYSTLSSVLNPVDNKFSFYGIFLVLTKCGSIPGISRLQYCLQNIKFSLNDIIFYSCTFPLSFFIIHDVSDAVSASFYRQGGPKLLDPSDLLCLISERNTIGTTVAYWQPLSYTRGTNETVRIITLTRTTACYRSHAIKVH